ncbi:MAG TPA: hypothetical protein VKG23_20265 [Thermoanaerobaculia bacterium]|nr:hypothetical protein [Thermoanaerobaculia bacterium]
MSSRPRGFAARCALAALALAFCAGRAAAFDSKGHVVIEALVYRSLVEGHDGRAPQPDVLRDLFNDGALAPPLCFGWDGHPPSYCADISSNPLLDWPRPLTDQPDAAFRRQFSDAGQCFHFMAKLEDAESEPIAGTKIPRALATTALVRCTDLLDDLLRQVVIDGGPGTRASGYGLYELMHTIGDSFSGAHTQRQPGTLRIEALRVWKPLTRLPGLTPERVAKIPDSAFHKWDDRRDKTYVVPDRTTTDGRRCKSLVDTPYAVPHECLSEEGDNARRAIVELLVVVRDLRMAQKASPASEPAPERSEAWRAYKERWFAAAYPCQGDECREQQPPDLSPGSYGLLGLDTTYNATRKFFDAAAKGTIFKYSSGLNPFVYALAAEVGYRRYNDGTGAGLAGLDLDLVVPIGKRAALGFTAAGWRVVFGGNRTGSEITTDFFRFDYFLNDRLALTLHGPLEIDWRKPAAELSFGVGVSWALSSPNLAGGPLIRRHADKVERTDEEWSPPEAPYGRLEGRTASWYVGTGVTTVQTPSVAVEGRTYGAGSIDGMVLWDRDRWGGKFAWVPGGSLAVGVRSTSGNSAYLTGALGLDLRWYPIRVLALALTPVRVEGGPKIRGQEETDGSPGVHGAPGSEYYLQAGSRVGIAFNAGIVDILVQGPTIAWSSSPFAAKEILSVLLSIRLN